MREKKPLLNYVLESWKRFLKGDQWRPGLNELADVSQADMSQVPKNLFQKLAKLISHYYGKHSSAPSRLAIFAPRPVQHGMSRMYIAWADDSAQTIRIFDDIEEAKSWVRVV